MARKIYIFKSNADAARRKDAEGLFHLYAMPRTPLYTGNILLALYTSYRLYYLRYHATPAKYFL